MIDGQRKFIKDVFFSFCESWNIQCSKQDAVTSHIYIFIVKQESLIDIDYNSTSSIDQKKNREYISGAPHLEFN